MFDPCVYFALSSFSARVRSLGKICATFSRLREFALHFPTNLVFTKKGMPPGGLLLGILGGGVPPDSLNPDPISDQTRSQSLLICSSKAMKDFGEMMSRSRGRLGRAIFVRPSLDAMRSSQNRLRSNWERV